MTITQQVTLTLSTTDLEALRALTDARGPGYFGAEYTDHLLAELAPDKED